MKPPRPGEHPTEPQPRRDPARAADAVVPADPQVQPDPVLRPTPEVDPAAAGVAGVAAAERPATLRPADTSDRG